MTSSIGRFSLPSAFTLSIATWIASRSGIPNTAAGPLKLRTTPILTGSADSAAPLDSTATATADKTSEIILRMASLPGNYYVSDSGL